MSLQIAYQLAINWGNRGAAGLIEHKV